MKVFTGASKPRRAGGAHGDGTGGSRTLDGGGRSGGGFKSGARLEEIRRGVVGTGLGRGSETRGCGDRNRLRHAGTAFHHNAFLIVSNGHRARYGSITSGWEHFAEWKRNDERDKGSLDAQVLLDGMLAKDRLLDIVENYILFDASKPGSPRKVVARNHQVLGVNLAVDATRYQEALKLEYPERKAVS